ncbi:MAG: methylated-DNA--[protein]-cysteine S-methyltransferase [Muribaculaceae bacterium]|nr:methylated-DNA--[protein]-cysteine S-methyltransferase [Muribaculaceae bacterium]
MNNIYSSIYKSPIGNLKITADDFGLLSINICSDTKKNNSSNIAINNCIALMDKYFDGNNVDFSGIIISENIMGTEFQKKVWLALRKIKYGNTSSYSAIASQIGCNKGYQAVGNAIGMNPILIIIPCHRIIAKTGNISGFSAGIEIKRFLLKLENIKI